MIGKVTYWNQPKGFGFIAVTTQHSALEALSQEQFFFHHSQFTKGEVPVLGAYVVFTLGEPYAAGRKVQAVGVRFATTKEIVVIKDAAVLAGIEALKAANTTVIAGVEVMTTKVGE
jgi:cold shock CspA family protein